MQDDTRDPNFGAANNQDVAPVTVCFSDPDISEVFAELVRSRGVPALIARAISDIRGETRVITEPSLFPTLPASYHAKTLLVGTKESVKELKAKALTKPLTEEKVEEAMDALLRS